LEYRDNNGETPLHWAAVEGNYNILEIILKKYKGLQIVPDPKNNVINMKFFDFKNIFI
jgi:ankyrin repeat protein